MIHKNISRFLDFISKPRNFLILLVLFIILTVYLDITSLPYGVADFTAHTNGGKMLDMSVGYTPDQAYQMITDYGTEGRGHYIRGIFIADILFPVIYTLFLISTLSLLLKQLVKPESRLQYIAFLPLVNGISDILENVSILTMLIYYPIKLNLVALLASAFTIIKFGGFVTVVILTLICLVLALYRRLIKKIQ